MRELRPVLNFPPELLLAGTQCGGGDIGHHRPLILGGVAVVCHTCPSPTELLTPDAMQN